MKRKRFSDEQIIGVLKESEAGMCDGKCGKTIVEYRIPMLILSTFPSERYKDLP